MGYAQCRRPLLTAIGTGAMDTGRTSGPNARSKVHGASGTVRGARCKVTESSKALRIYRKPRYGDYGCRTVIRSMLRAEASGIMKCESSVFAHSDGL